MEDARHVIGCQFTQYRRVPNAFHDVASTIHQSLRHDAGGGRRHPQRHDQHLLHAHGRERPPVLVGPVHFEQNSGNRWPGQGGCGKRVDGYTGTRLASSEVTGVTDPAWRANNMSDHVHYHHAGGTCIYNIVHPDGTFEVRRLGSNVAMGDQPQLAGC
jgi:hypothetical protein